MEWEVVETKRLCWLRHQPTAGVKVRVARLERKCTGEMIKDKINGLWWLTGYGNERHESHMTSKLQAWASWRLMVSSELLEGLLLFRSLVLPASVYHCPNLFLCFKWGCGKRRFLWCLTILSFNHSATGFSKVLWCWQVFLILRASCPQHCYQWKGHHAMMSLSILLAFGHEYQCHFYTVCINIFQETVSWLGNFILFP